MNKYKLAKVDWIDVSTQDAWRTIEDAKDQEDYIVHTIGWVLSDTKKYLTLGTGLSSNGLSAATWRIPKGMVIKRTNIKGFDLTYE